MTSGPCAHRPPARCAGASGNSTQFHSVATLAVERSLLRAGLGGGLDLPLRPHPQLPGEWTGPGASGSGDFIEGGVPPRVRVVDKPLAHLGLECVEWSAMTARLRKPGSCCPFRYAPTALRSRPRCWIIALIVQPCPRSECASTGETMDRLRSNDRVCTWTVISEETHPDIWITRG
jgi:hypothetical protein